MARIVVGVAGGIAAYKVAGLVRWFGEAGHDVTVIPTAAALEFVGAPTWAALSHHPVATDVWTDAHEVPHVTIGRHADLVVVAPATADLLARAAHGLADDLLTSTLLTARGPVLMAPAMHTEMWEHPAVAANVATLRQRGVTVVEPAMGRLTGSDTGRGRLPDIAHIGELAELLLVKPDALPPDLVGCQVLVTAGGTREPIDPVRFIGNHSSGRQGYAVAIVAAARGAHVTLVAANTDLADPPGTEVHRAVTAADLREHTLRLAAAADVIVMAAAVADFRPAEAALYKIKKGARAEPDPIALLRNPDILAELVAARDGAVPVLVGFAAETGDPHTDFLTYGRQKLERKGCDLLVVNAVGAGRAFGQPDNAATIIGRLGEAVDVPLGSKAALAAVLWDAVARYRSIEVARPGPDSRP